MNRFAWPGVFLGECEDKQCSTLVDNALSVNSPHVYSVCAMCTYLLYTPVSTFVVPFHALRVCALFGSVYMWVGDLVLRGLLILICVRDLSLRFLFCLFAGLNLFKLTTRATDSDVLLFALVCACNLICLI